MDVTSTPTGAGAMDGPNPSEADRGSRGNTTTTNDGTGSYSGAPHLRDVVDEASAPDTTRNEKKPSSFKLQRDGGDIELSEDDINKLLRGMKHKVNINGKVDEVDYDTLIKERQLQQVSYEKMKEAAAKAKNAESSIIQKITEQLKANPKVAFDLMKHVGHDPKKFAEDLLFEEFKLASMSPEQRELHELKQWKASTEAEKMAQEKAQAEVAQRQKFDAEKSHFTQQFDEELSKIITESPVKPSLQQLETMTAFMLASEYLGQPMSAREAHQRMQALSRQFFDHELRNSSEESFSKLPKEFLDKVRKSDVSRITQTSPTRKAQAPQQSNQRSAPPPTIEDFFDNLDKRSQLKVR